MAVKFWISCYKAALNRLVEPGVCQRRSVVARAAWREYNRLQRENKSSLHKSLWNGKSSIRKLQVLIVKPLVSHRFGASALQNLQLSYVSHPRLTQ